MILYHGSNVAINAIELSQSMRGKDFGQGFYLSADKKQAEEMAVFKAMQYDGTPMTNVQYMNECMMRDLAVMLIDKYHVSLVEALDILYNSDTYVKLQDSRTGLYFQSPVYVFDFLQKELEQGKIA